MEGSLSSELDMLGETLKSNFSSSDCKPCAGRIAASIGGN